MTEQISKNRRQFLRAAAMGVAGAPLLFRGSARAQSAATPARATFAALKQINAGALNVGYAEDGPADGPPIVLLHGWPYDIHSFIEVAPLLAKAGHRVIVPHLRGHGTTRFLASDAIRNGEPAALAVDIIALRTR